MRSSSPSLNAKPLSLLLSEVESQVAFAACPFPHCVLDDTRESQGHILPGPQHRVGMSAC